MTRGLILIGAGGHAKVVAAAWRRAGGAIDAYVDRTEAPWTGAARIADDAAALAQAGRAAFALAFVGAAIPDLARRLALMERYAAAGCDFPTIVDPSALVSAAAGLGRGVQVLGMAVVNAGAAIDTAAVVNTGAIVEHDATVGEGAHIAPGAIILGNARIGARCLIGAGAVVLPAAAVPPGTLVPALARYPQ